MIHKRPFMIVALIAHLLLVAGCASQVAPANDGKQHAECLVCKHNADLACVDVVVDSKTPRVDYDGQTYYFCSDECKRDFAKAPAKYAHR